MITLTRLSGSQFVLNSDLIERIDSTPDTVITLVDGKKYLVAESLTEIIAAVQDYRGTVIAVSSRLAEGAPPPPPRHSPLATVSSLHGEG